MLKTDLTKRVYGLDILRAIAILSVLFFHYQEYLPSFLGDLLYPLVRNGVPYFFVLSGFLVGSILIKTLYKGPFTFKNLFTFWSNRWIRTIPPYYVTLVLIIGGTYFFNRTFYPEHFTVGQFGKFFIFLQNISSPRLGFFVESWSLSVEEWFYLITPFTIFILIWLFKLNAKRSVLLMIIGLTSIVIVSRYIKYTKGIVYDEFVMFNRLDGIMFGVLGAYLNYYYKETWDKMKYKFLFIGISLFVLDTFKCAYVDRLLSYQQSSFKIFYTSVINDTIAPFITFFFLPFLTSIKTGKGKIYKALTYTSLISYSLYLMHFTVVKYCIVETIHREHYELSNLTRFILCFALSYLFATIMYLFIEKPCMDLRKKIKFLQK